MLSYRTLTLRAGLAALVAMVGLAQIRTPDAIRSQVERAQDVGTPVVRAQVEPVTNWATPLYWHPGAAAAQAGARAKRVEATGAQDSTPTSGLGAPAVFVAITPCRLVDTRVAAGFTGAFGPPAMPANTARSIPVPTSSCGVPAAVAYSLNLTVVPAPGVVLGWAAAWPDDQPQPNTAVLSDMFAGTIVSNSAIVPAGADGGFDVLTLRATDLVIDINGYFALPETLPFGGTALAPALTFGDTTTGLYSTGAGSVSIATNGVNALTIGPTGNLDLPGSITKGGTLFLHNLAKCGFPAACGANTALGLNALAQNAGASNTAIGEGALQANTTGFWNVAIGANAMPFNTTGHENVAVGLNTMASQTPNNQNTAIGHKALEQVLGDHNTALGYEAGIEVEGSNNIDIASSGNPFDNGVIRIGDTQVATLIAGIYGAQTALGPVPVVIDSAGQLGTVSSARRVKRDIADMGDTTDTLMSLRPVQFRYTAHGPDAPLQYGLIAEEVAEVAPELVAHKAGGEIETVFYDKVNAMLLNEVQKLHRENAALAETLRKLESRLAGLEQSPNK
jgi:hypothetical protein